MAPESSVRTQDCRGERKGRLFRLRCEPLAALIDGDMDDSGDCSILFMQPSFSKEDWRITVPSVVAPRSGYSECGTIPPREGVFSITVDLSSRTVNQALTLQARDSAVEYYKGGVYGKQCRLHFPKVSTGDPFFHVYVECNGVLEVVAEFPIRSGRAASYSHWDYTRRRGSLPYGAEKRLANSDLWLTLPVGSVTAPKSVGN